MQPALSTHHAAAPLPAAVPAPKVAIVILNWNNGAATLTCLAALRSIVYPNYNVVVVDNNSTDGSIQHIGTAAAIDLVINPTNLGYTGGVNIGIARALALGADYIWLLNNDAVSQPDVLCRLVAAAEADDQIGLVSPVFHDPDQPEVAVFRAGRFDPLSRHMAETSDHATAQTWQQHHPDQLMLPGTALLIRRCLIETIGLLDTKFFAYVEDVDYCLRAYEAGFRTRIVPDAVVFHAFKQPVQHPNEVPAYLHYFMTRNYLLLWRKLPRPMVLRKATLWFLHQRLRQISLMPDIQPAVEAVLAGLWDGIRGTGGPYRPERKAPWLLRATLARHPNLCLAVLNGQNPFSRLPV